MESRPLSLAELPACISTYFSSVNHRQCSEAAACFATDAVVHDEEEDRIGRDAIYVWIEDTTKRYQHQTELLEAAASADEKFSVTARVTGQFPGSPVELQYDFTLAGDHISRLAID